MIRPISGYLVNPKLNTFNEQLRLPQVIIEFIENDRSRAFGRTVMLRFYNRQESLPAKLAGPPIVVGGKANERAPLRRSAVPRYDETHVIHPSWLALSRGESPPKK
jgi:hypothetical protein